MLSAVLAPRLPLRDRLVIFASIAVITALAWAYLFQLDRQMAAGMAYEKAMAAMGMTSSWTAADAFFTFAMWTVMMAGMMAVSAAPVILLYAAAQTKRHARGALLPVAAFGLGYLAVWAGFSTAATLAQWILHRAALLSPAMAASKGWIGALILTAAGVYQFTPWKGACLAHCRGPLGYLMTHWRDGRLGGFQMGALHGWYCLGCCWALMVVLFAVGVMNLVWVAALTVFVLIEKVAPAGGMVSRAAGGAMLAFGIYRLAAAI